MANHRTTYLLVLLIFHSIFLESRACHPTDREALLDFKRRITADPSKLLESWIPDKDCCTRWAGIACDTSTGRVLNLTCPGRDWDSETGPIDTSMSGTLSPFIGNISSLQVLDLGNLKELKGRIPFELGKLALLVFGLKWS
ncbi:DNA damage-repair/toleration protein DRT100-like [Salvia splendens]|uniref:DNA damage-repair/toleration protein DRT100-like n=1 Tax=Salvia splendens TaxID=180675 RepID=UPI001C26520E|nr:DNA damage-repair/toleration protein DRT100-like [Salvia splendens]